MKWKNKGHEYDHMSFRFRDRSMRLFIWGAGIFGKSFFERFEKEFCCVAFIDSSKEKQGRDLCGMPVISPKEFLDVYTDEIVVVSTGQTFPVYQELERFGLKRYQDFFHIDEFSSMYMMYVHDKVFVSDITVDITECCTLKCEYCNGFIPKIPNPRNFQVDFIREELEQYFRWVDEVNVLGLCGGDAMAHPQFDEILQWVGDQYYPARAKHIEVYSNAVIIPDEKIIELFKKYHVIYRFTNYSGHSGRQNIEGIVRLLEENGISYDHAKLTAWYDCGYPQKSNGIAAEEGLIRFFDHCDRKTCHSILGNKLFFCGMCVGADRIGYCNIADGDYFDLSEYNQERRMEFLEYYLGYSEKGYFSYCRMCNGSSNVNKHIIPVGMQEKHEKGMHD